MGYDCIENTDQDNSGKRLSNISTKETAEKQTVTRSGRLVRKPSYLKDYVLNWTFYFYLYIVNLFKDLNLV